MAIDPYSPCPCASGKKIKFCCGANIVSDLDKIVRMIEGEQRVAALDHVNRTIDKHGRLASLMSLKVRMLLELNELDKAAEAVEQFFQDAPDSPNAMAYASLLAATRAELDRSIELLHRALQCELEFLPESITNALEVLVSMLIKSPAMSTLFAGIGHAHLMASFTVQDGEDDELQRLVASLNRSQRVPILFKQFRTLLPCPANVPWSDEFNAANDAINDGRWLQGAQQFASLDKRHPRQPAILHNLAMVQGWLNRSSQAVDSWRRLSLVEDLPLDDAVEAEAMAQLLQDSSDGQTVDDLKLTYPVKDVDGLMERLLSHELAQPLEFDASLLAAEGEPPPKGLFWLLDKPFPPADQELTRDNIPSVIGELTVYGKQTDREAVAYFHVVRTDDYWLKTTTAAEVLGGMANPCAEEVVLQQLPAESVALSKQWRFPPHTPIETQKALVDQETRHMMTQQWPATPRGVLEGKTPKQAVADPSLRLRVLGHLLIYELQSKSNSPVDVNQLRASLGLPQREKIVLPENVEALHLCRFPYYDVSRLSTSMVGNLFTYSLAFNYYAAAKSLGEQLLRRESSDEPVPEYAIQGALSKIADDQDEALHHVQRAQQSAVAAGVSPAAFLLHELDLRFQRLESAHCQSLLDRLQSQHAREEGVRTGIYKLLVKYGLIRPDGTPVHVAPRPHAPADEAVETTEPTPSIWTPDAPSSAADGPGKSKLWVPGM